MKPAPIAGGTVTARFGAAASAGAPAAVPEGDEALTADICAQLDGESRRVGGLTVGGPSPSPPPPPEV